MPSGIIVLVWGLWMDPLAHLATKFNNLPFTRDTLRTFLKTELTRTQLQSIGIKPLTRSGSWWTANLSLKLLKDLKKNRSISILWLGTKTEPTTENSTPFTLVVYDTLTSSIDTVHFQSRGGFFRILLIPQTGLGGLALSVIKGDSVVLSDTNSGPGGNPLVSDTITPGSYRLIVSSNGYLGPYLVFINSSMPITLGYFNPNHFRIGSGQIWSLSTQQITGVLIGNVDTGVDFDHPDFIDDSTGLTRLFYAWDQTLVPVSGESPPPWFPYGVEYDSSWFNNMPGSVRMSDTYGHGTYTLGIMGSDGSATDGDLPPYTFIGGGNGFPMATVKTTFYDTDIVDGVDYLIQRAGTMGLGSVINLSLRGHYGPHDGTSPFAQMLSGLSGNGKIIVVAVGNDQKAKLHSKINATTVPITINLEVYKGSTYTNFWHDGNDSYRVTVEPPEHDTTNDWVWDSNILDNPGVPNYPPSPGDTSGWVTGYGNVPENTYSPSNSNFLDSPKLPYLQGTKLLITHWFEFEDNKDGAMVLVTTNDTIYLKIYPNSGYNGTVLYQDAFTGPSLSWRIDTFDIPLQETDSFRIRFLFYSDDNNQYQGWIISSVELDTGNVSYYREDFSYGSAGYSTGHLNSLTVEPGLSQILWLGGSPENGGGTVIVDYPSTPYPDNGDHVILIAIEDIYPSYPGHSSKFWKLTFERRTFSGDGRVDGWVFYQSNTRNRFRTHVSKWNTVGIPATADSVISVGATTNTIIWDIESGGTYFESVAFDMIGELAGFSSLGPRRDGAIRPHIVAPGYFVVSSRSLDAPSGPLVTLKDFYHRAGAGTSASSPIVSSAIAHLIESNINLTPSQALDSLITYSIRDSRMQLPPPDSLYGWGRLFTPFSNIPFYIPGDANGDGIVDSKDAVFLSRYLSFGAPEPSPKNSGDYDNNGSIDFHDVSLLLSTLFSE